MMGKKEFVKSGAENAEGKKILGFKRNVFFLGLVSFFNDMASEIIYPLIPMFVTTVLGAGAVFLGVIEGIAESLNSFLKLLSGWFSDRVKKTKPLVVFGYTVSNIARPLIGIAAAPWHVLVNRVFDRFGKGVRNAPRDALLSASVDEKDYGKSFSFQRALDHAGAMIGPLIASALLFAFHQNYRAVFLLSVVPGAVAVFIAAKKVKEKKTDEAEKAEERKEVKLSLKGFDTRFKWYLLLIVLFTLGNSTDAFLLLRAQNTGIAIVLIPLLWSLFHVIKSASSVPFGFLSDKIGHRNVVLSGWLLYALVYLGFAFAGTAWHIWGLFLMYGLYYGMTEGVEKALVADLVTDKSRRGTAYGLYNCAIGISAFPASVLMGILWKFAGIRIAFGFGSGLALVAAVGLLFLVRTR